MFRQRLSKIGNEFVVVIPDQEVERNGWREGQWLELQVNAVNEASGMPEDLRQALDERWERNEKALRYLADR